MMVFVIAYSIGAGTDINRGDAENLRQQFNEQVEDIDQNGIFMNNLRISLGMFIPALGIGLGLFSGFSTGLIFNVIAENSPLLNNVSPLVILITPFGVMEIFAYGLAMSRSGMLIYQIVKKKQWIGIVIAILLIGASIEWQMITQFDGQNVDLSV
jgi:uncharacterized membrane protein SpoIIM required for sporulation